jgi:hypothetical protein
MRATKHIDPFLAVLLFVAAQCLAAEDDEVVVGPLTVNSQEQMMQRFGIADFDQMVFQNVGNPKLGRQRLQEQINLQLKELDHECHLTDSQKKRLELAARGDMQRFMDEVEVQRRKFDAIKNDPDALNNVWQEIQPLQLKMARGLTGPGSLLLKIVPKTLTPEQAKSYEAKMSERRLYRYRANIAVALHMLGGTVALTQVQSEAFTELLLTLPAPQSAGQYDVYLIIYRISDLPPEKLKALLDDRRYEALKRQLDVYRASRNVLIEQGMIEREDLAEAATATPAPEAQR